MVNELHFGSSQEAWEKINEMFILDEEKMVTTGASRSGGLLLGYDYLVYIRNLWVDPEFDYGKLFNYRIQKWRTLVSNYVNLDYLDLVKSEVLRRESKKANAYNISFIFDNSHGSGKGCLLSLTFARRVGGTNPILIFSLRSSEIVKRLNFDFLLVQRMGEYVYGKNRNLSGIVYFPNIYTSAETSAMYSIHRPFEKLFKAQIKSGNWAPFQKKVWDAYQKYSNVDPEKVTYKVHQRVAKALQTAKIPPLLAKDLII